MGVSLDIKAYSSPENKEFQKHFKAVKFCLENNLSYPIETSEFFKGKLDGDDLEDVREEYVLDYIENGIEIPLKQNKINECEIHIKVSDIPKEANLIIFKLK